MEVVQQALSQEYTLRAVVVLHPRIPVLRTSHLLLTLILTMTQGSSRSAYDKSTLAYGGAEANIMNEYYARTRAPFLCRVFRQFFRAKESEEDQNDNQFLEKLPGRMVFAPQILKIYRSQLPV